MNALDLEGDSCTHYLKYHLGMGCDGSYDDDDFTASEMCCGCNVPAQTSCVNTNFDALDSTSNDCDLEGYEDFGYACGRYDTSTFSASSMCCACGGGFVWELQSFEQHWDSSALYAYDNEEGTERLCENTNDYETNSRGETCVDLVISQHYGVDVAHQTTTLFYSLRRRIVVSVAVDKSSIP